VQRSLRRYVLGESLVERRTSHGKAPRSLSLQTLRTQTAGTFPPTVSPAAQARPARGKSHSSRARKAPRAQLRPSSREFGDALLRVSQCAHGERDPCELERDSRAVALHFHGVALLRPARSAILFERLMLDDSNELRYSDLDLRYRRAAWSACGDLNRLCMASRRLHDALRGLTIDAVRCVEKKDSEDVSSFHASFCSIRLVSSLQKSCGEHVGDEIFLSMSCELLLLSRRAGL
jgi:hypothetical protein